MTLLSLGVIGSSAKENEHRLPLHPEHIPHLDADLRAESFDPDAAALRGMAFERLDQLALEHLYGVRG